MIIKAQQFLVSANVYDRDQGVTHTRFATATMADVDACQKWHFCSCAPDSVRAELRTNHIFECRQLYERLMAEKAAAEPPSNPLEAWITEWGIHLDWEAKDALRRAVAEWMRQELPTSAPLE